MGTAQAETERHGSHRLSPETALYVWKCGAASGSESQQPERLVPEVEIRRANPEMGTRREVRVRRESACSQGNADKAQLGHGGDFTLFPDPGLTFLTWLANVPMKRERRRKEARTHSIH